MKFRHLGIQISELEVSNFIIGVPIFPLKTQSLESDRISSCFHESSIGKLAWRDAIAIVKPLD
ncbi:hypothetical protein [Nostoc sp.]|uniref:hypothetical protein n=1 Tax=Nostoc sp. TaxID=1180 RepID=UPI002FFD53CD